MYGVIDIGSNTIRLVIFKLENNELVTMINKKYSAGLANYIDSDNYLNRRGVDKAIEALMDFKEILKCINVKEVLPFATASLRNITNSDEVVRTIKNETGFDVVILTGEEEALFDYYGVIHSVGADRGLMVDVGGGSSEIVFFENNKATFSTSLPCGSLKLFRQFVDSIIPTKKELNLMKKSVGKTLRSSDIPSRKYCSETMVAVGGSARAVQKLLVDMDVKYTDEYSAAALDNLICKLEKDSSSLYRDILKSSADRIHTFTPGLVLLHEMASYFGSKKIITSRYGVREGYLYYMLKKRAAL